MGKIFYKRQMDALAFGVLPAYRKYELYHARYHEMRQVFEEVFQGRGEAIRVLDVGAGQGEAKRFIDAMSTKPKWHAVEIDPKRVKILQGLGYEQVVDAVDLERERLPFPDNHFDIVIASHVLEHLENASFALADWNRVLAPGGALILGLPMHLPPVAALARLKYRIKGRRPRGHCHFFSMGSLRAFLSEYDVRRIWGFRFLSARQQLPLEDWEWFYRASLWVGRRFPGVCAEVNVHLGKSAPRALGPGSSSAAA